MMHISADIVSANILTIERHGRRIALQRVSEAERFHALIRLGVREPVAQAVVANLVTVRVIQGVRTCQ